MKSRSRRACAIGLIVSLMILGVPIVADEPESEVRAYLSRSASFLCRRVESDAEELHGPQALRLHASLWDTMFPRRHNSAA
jgi:hypothetical protein